MIKKNDILGEAIEALGNINHPRTIVVLKKAYLQADDPYVRDLAADT